MDETMLGARACLSVSSRESRCKAAEPLALSSAIPFFPPRRCPGPVANANLRSSMPATSLLSRTHNSLSSLTHNNDGGDEREEQQREERRPASMRVCSGASESLPLHSLEGKPKPMHLISHGRR